MSERTKLLVLSDRTHDPVKNLIREEELFRRVESGELPDLVRFWSDSGCLVRGKARSARYGWYREALARRMRIKIVERATGGGVVYHDQGNLNWSFFFRHSGPLLSPTKIFGRASGYMVRALADLGVDAQFAPPNRIDVRGHKVSGMAARSTPRAYLVHGTLLLHTDLEKLNKICIPPPGCPPVANLEQWVPGVKAAQVVAAVVDVLKESGFDVERQ
jgi:lipoate-protein ligase A